MSVLVCLVHSVKQMGKCQSCSQCKVAIINQHKRVYTANHTRNGKIDKFQGGHYVQVVFNYRFCCLGSMVWPYLRCTWPHAAIMYTNATTHLVISPKPLETPSQKFYHL